MSGITMKIGRNDPCLCGSGKKFKKCCMETMAEQRKEIHSHISQAIAENPDIGIDELNELVDQKVSNHNNAPVDEFCGLSPNQMQSWANDPFEKKLNIKISTPIDCSASPVMYYLQLIIDEALANKGAFKATDKGNLPAKLVKKANEFIGQFSQAEHYHQINEHEFSGSLEQRFNALHYARVLAELAGIIKFENGKYYLMQETKTLYEEQGIQAFFLPLLEQAVSHFNWGYFDNWDDEIYFQFCWLFMLWRLQSHLSIEQLTQELLVVHPQLKDILAKDPRIPVERQLASCIECRFITRFLSFWGFASISGTRYGEEDEITLLPLLSEVFEFNL